MKEKGKLIETRYYNTDASTLAPIDDGVQQVAFYEYGMTVSCRNYETHETCYNYCKRWYPHIMADLKADPLPTRYYANNSTLCKATRWIQVR